MTEKKNGRLVIIGGHEDGEEDILTEICEPVSNKDRLLVIVTVATNQPEEVARDYRAKFEKMGVSNIEVLDIRTREEAHDEKKVEILKKASVIFFTGGDQLRIASQIGDSPVFQTMLKRYKEGCTIAGTSAGAAVMPANMLIFGHGDESFKAYELGMAAGLGFIDDVIVDTHFAERGRMGRILGAVAQNPRNVGIGIDEATAIVIENHSTQFRVIGKGAVYLVDGTGISYSSLSEGGKEGVVSIFDVKLHVLAAGDCYDLVKRRPIVNPEAEFKPE